MCGHFDVDNDAEKTLDLGYTVYGIRLPHYSILDKPSDKEG